MRDLNRVLWAVFALVSLVLVLSPNGDGDLTSCLAGCKTGQGEILHLIRFAVCIILRLIQLLCVIASVLAITLAGIMWISSDSSSQRATAKKIIMFALLGLIVVMIVIQIMNAFITGGGIYSIICETTIDSSIYDPIETVACVLFRVLQVGAILLAAVILTLSGIMWVGSDSPEDRIRARNMMVYTIIGFLVVVLVLLFLGTIIAPGIPYTFDCDSIITAPSGIQTTLQYVACIALRLFQYAAVLLAVAIIAFSGVRFIISDRPEERTKARNMIAYTIVGFLVVFTAIALINVALVGVAGTIPLTSIDCSITSGAPTDLENIRDTLHNTACIVIQVVNLSVAVIASLIVVLAGIYFYTSDNPVSRNKAKILVAQTVVGLIIILLAMNLVSSLFAGGGITSVEDATGAIFTNDCGSVILGFGIENVTDPINKVLCVMITIFQSISTIILVLVVMAAGFRWAISDSPEDRVQSKRMVVYGVIGILLILISTNIIYALISAVSGGVISSEFINPLGGISNCRIDEGTVGPVTDMVKAVLCVILLAGFFLSGIIIALIIVYAGLKWVTSDSPRDRTEAKWIIIKALIGYILIQVASQLVMALSSALVTLDISGIGSISGFFDFLGDLFGEPYIVTCFVHLGLGGGTEGFIGLGIVFGQLWFIFCYLLRMLQIVAFAAASIIIAVAGLKWIGSDSPEQRSYARDRVLHALVGLFIVLLATSIVDALSLIALLSDMVSDIPLIGQLIGPLFDALLEDVFHVDELYGSLCPGWADVVGIIFSEQLRLLACILIRILQGVAAMLATIVILLSGINWMGSDSYGDRVRARDRILHAIIGLLIVMVALQLVNVFVVAGTESDWLTLDCGDTDTGGVVTLANTLGCIIVKILESLAGMLAAILIIIMGYRWMTSEIPEERVKHRNRIFSILVGLAITILALQLVMAFVSNHGFMQINPDCNPLEEVDCSSPGDELEEVVCTALYVGCLFIRIIMYIVAAVGLLMIIWAGIKWITSESPAERARARNTVIAVIIALIVILLAMAFINYMVTGTRILSFFC
ncbi:MAG: hypothetical protein B6U72_05365 [Candidatus Altiarchaeales archaeon ex4484_2]|nr:MAG: hypothetical protein B6U72_05365 [Candidatus Altiarchaeales archaeon ex4484_2]